MVVTFRMNFKTEKIQYLLWALADSPEAPYCFPLGPETSCAQLLSTRKAPSGVHPL